MFTPTHLVDAAQIAQEIELSSIKLVPGVVRVKHTVTENFDGDPAIYFRILLTAEASREDNISRVTSRVMTLVFDENPYFKYRSESEQAALGDVAWA